MPAKFYQTKAGNEPVREWLKGLDVEDKKTIGGDIQTVQYGWPIGMPLVDNIERDIWEIRSRIRNGIARVLFAAIDGRIVLLHGFVKKTPATPDSDKKLKAGPEKTQGSQRRKNMNRHIGSDFEDFLTEEGLLADAKAVAIKRILAFQLEEEMKKKHISKRELAEKMSTSRSSVDRLLDPANPSVTLRTLEAAAEAIGKRLTISFA